MHYQGNPSLAQDVQERISNTFQQTLNLVTDQRDQEALVGCEFILRMDPLFQPAKTLVARLKSGQRPIPIDDLKSPAAAPPPAAPASPEAPSSGADGRDDLGDLDDLGSLDDLDELGDLGDLDLGDDLAAAPPAAPARPAAPAPRPPAPAAAPPASGSGLAAVVSDLLDKRNFRQILQIAEKQREAVEKDPEVGAMVEKARTLLESEAYVQAFLTSAREAFAAGRPDEVASHLKKARALDPEHPDLQVVARETAPDADLMALQERSLSLDAGAAGQASEADETVEKLGRDPRQTKPMAAVPAADAPAAPPPAEDLTDEEPLDLSDEPDFDFASGAGDEPDFDDATDDAGGLDDELFDADEDDSLDDLDAELFDDQAEPPPLADTETAAVELPPDDQDAGAEGGDRVGELLAEGQAAFDRGDYQVAIDVWSRIFLIDIDNAEASGRIEEARNKKAELERQAEELFHEAVGQLESESIEEAKGTLARVLELAPAHSLAREYLEQLEAGQVPATGGDLDALIASDAELGGDGVDADRRSLDAAVARDRVVVTKRTDRRIIALGAVVLLAVLGTAAFLTFKWDDLFPNQEPPPTMAQQAPKVDPIERATRMQEGGNTENAILLLERIQPEDPIYEDAQALIAQWKALVEAPPELGEAGPSEEQVRRHALLIEGAREAHKQGRNIRARDYFGRAIKILPLALEDQELQQAVEENLVPLAEEIKLFEQGQYTAVIPNLWRMRDDKPSDLDVERLLIDSYYNLALTDLQRGDAQGAARKLREALEVQPDNQELQRLQLFAQTYAQRRPDLLHRIFVKYLPSR